VKENCLKGTLSHKLHGLKTGSGISLDVRTEERVGAREQCFCGTWGGKRKKLSPRGSLNELLERTGWLMAARTSKRTLIAVGNACEYESLEGRSVMKQCWIVAVVLLMFSFGIASAAEFGPPEPLAKPGKFAIGLGYSQSSEKLKAEDGTGFGSADFWQKTEFTQKAWYLQLNYGLCKNWEMFLRFGLADLEAKDAFNYNTSTENFKDTNQFFTTLGFKGVMYSNSSFSMGPFKSFSMGPILKGSYYSEYKDTSSGVIGGTLVTQEYKARNIWDVNLALSMQTKVSNVTLFAGPFVYWRNINSELAVSIPGSGVFVDSAKYQSEYNVGGFAGLRVPVTKRLTLDVEGRYTDSFGAGAALMYSF
jgi:hypothetical protein